MYVTTFGKLAIVASMASLIPTALAWADDASPAWKKGEAAKYLDERANVWFSFTAADRGEGATKTTCVSCHTLLPIVLARPALRKVTGVSEATEFEKRFLDQRRQRVQKWKELDSPKIGLFYDFNEQKKKESWGTEAVLNALVLAWDDFYQKKERPSDATRQAFANLWRIQLPKGEQKGSWDWLNFGLEPWESKDGRFIGAAMAAIAVGTAPGYYVPETDDGQIEDKVDLLRGYLKGNLAGQNLHNRVWALWASKRLCNVLTEHEQKVIVEELLAKQQGDGGWRLSALGNFARSDQTPQDTSSDGYATGLVLYVLQVAGVPKTDAKVARGLNWLRAAQSPTGEWRASSVNKKRDPATQVGKFMSEAATGYAVLALCQP